jgi:hypothetical protein
MRPQPSPELYGRLVRRTKEGLPARRSFTRPALVPAILVLGVLSMAGLSLAAGGGNPLKALGLGGQGSPPSVQQYNGDDFAFCHAPAPRTTFFILLFGAAARAHEALHDDAHADHTAGRPFNTHIDDYPATEADIAHFEETGKHRCVSPPPHENLFQDPDDRPGGG